MLFKVSSTTLHKQLSRIAGAIPSKHALPIIENFLFEVDGKTLRISTTNLDITMQTRISVESEGDNVKIAVPSKILLDILKALPEQPISFRIDTETFGIEILSNNGTYKLSGEDGDDFPITELPEGTESVQMPIDALLKAVNQTLFAASTDEDKAALNGIYFNFGEHGAVFVATDAHRLVKYIRSDVTVSQPSNFIVPQKALNLLKSSLEVSNKDVFIHFNDNKAFFEAEEIMLICRLIEYKFPDYENVIPTENPNRLIVDKQALLGALKRVNIFANKTTHQVRFHITDGQLEISAEDPDLANEAKEAIKYDDYEGEPIEIGFNAALLIEVINNLDTDKAVVELSQPSRAGIVLPITQEEGENMLMLIMPIMLNSYA